MPIRKHLPVIIAGLVLISLISLNVLQDYLYAHFKDTGFYWSESLLYHTYWIYFLPIGFGISRLKKRLTFTAPPPLILYALLTGFVGSLLHLLFFTSVFIAVSHLLFEPPHRFVAILGTALSNHLYFTFPLYALLLPILHYRKGKTPSIATTTFPDQLFVKTGGQQTAIPVSDIQSITSDRPYAVIRTAEKKFFHRDSLTLLEKQLDPALFIRVHRSAIVQKTAIVTLNSRQNGDYDALLANGQRVRFSRHYRTRWETLLH